jgi:hypothetical protein
MVVYRDHKHAATAARCVEETAAFLRRISMGASVDHDDAAELLITMGEFESAVADGLCPFDDHFDGVLTALRGALVTAGHIFCKTWEQKGGEALPYVRTLERKFDEISRLRLPDPLCISVPEGYAYHGIYPETYYAAARRFFDETEERGVCCIGIRSIGTSLSAVVAAALEDQGCSVETMTLRPRGPVTDRCVRLSRELERFLAEHGASFFLIVDEGPGLSGSSFRSIAQKLSDAGIGDDRIALLPSWEPDGKGFINEAARSRWQKHRKFTVAFEEVWLASGRLCGSIPQGNVIDISAGKWRRIFFEREDDYPAVYPELERRKYLFLPGRGAAAEIPRLSELRKFERDGRSLFMLKFAGLGRYGRSACRRAQLIAEAGFSPPVEGYLHGFIMYRFILGRPLSVHQACGGLVAAIASYLAFLRRAFPSEQTRSFEEMATMIAVNASEGIGPSWSVRCSRAIAGLLPLYKNISVAVDGHMLPHEWIGTGNSYLKADHTDHHADHFFPGNQDIAWDIAGSIVEFDFGDTLRELLIDHYIACSGDGAIRGRLPFFIVAYCAYRLGLATLAADVLSSTRDGEKFRRLAVRYGAALKGMIEQSGR